MIDEIAPEESSPFRRLIDVSKLGTEPMTVVAAAEVAERSALARLLDLVDLAELSGEGAFRRPSVKGPVELSGRMRAHVVQRCVVTLEPLPVTLEVDFTRRFAPETELATAVDVDPEGDDQPDPLDGDTIDLGMVLAEELALALDPYPRKPGVDLDKLLANEPEVAQALAPPSPFAVLKGLQNRG